MRAVACEHPQAALAGIRILEMGAQRRRRGCVAMAISLAVLAPMSTSSVGGEGAGGF